MSTINDRIKEVVEDSELTKTAFAKKLNVSQQYISKLIKTGEPSELFKDALCSTFDINKEWLETGNGEKKATIDREDQLMTWAGNILKDESDSFKRRFVNMLMDLDEDGWDALERMALLLQKKD